MYPELRVVAAWQRSCCMLTLHRGWLPTSSSVYKLTTSFIPQALAAHIGSRSLTRVGSTSAEVQALDRASVARVLGHWTGEVELVQGHGTMEYVLWRQGYGC